MKILPEHFAYLQSQIQLVMRLNPDAIDRYKTGNFPGADRVKCLQTRFNHDLLRAAVPSKWICDNLYPYLNDDHLATALRKICPKLSTDSTVETCQE